MNNLIVSNHASVHASGSSNNKSTTYSANNALYLDLLSYLPDADLIDRVHELVSRERVATAELVAHLAEVDIRRLYLGLGCSSMFTYCTERLHLSESAAFARIEVARAARRLPRLLQELADGSLTLTAIRRLAPVLAPDNCDRLVSEARHRPIRDVEAMIARERPRPDAPSRVRRLPKRREHVLKRAEREPCLTLPEEDNASLVEPAVRYDGPPIQPTAPDRFRVQFTAGAEMRERIQRLQDLMRHRIPDGDLAAVIDAALLELLTKLEQAKRGSTAQRRPRCPTTRRTRAIPRAIQREVWRRDGRQCRFVADDGRRCSATGLLQFHHVVPFARGGATTVANLELRCQAHNAHEAEIAGLGLRSP